MTKIKAYFNYAPEYAEKHLFIKSGDDALLPATLEKATPGERMVPFLADDEAVDFLQAMMDAAYEAGLRPKGFEAVTGELKATERHLADMQKLVFNGNP